MPGSARSNSGRAALLLTGLLVLGTQAGASLAAPTAADAAVNQGCSVDNVDTVTASQVGTVPGVVTEYVEYASRNLVVYETIPMGDRPGVFTAASLDRDETKTLRVEKRHADASVHATDGVVAILGQTDDGGTIHFLNASAGVSSRTTFETGSAGGFRGMTVHGDEVAVQWRSKVVLYPLDGGEPREVTVEESDSELPPLATYQSPTDGVHVLQTQETSVDDSGFGGSVTTHQTTTKVYDDDLDLLWERTFDGNSYVDSAGGVMFTTHDDAVYQVDPRTGDRERVDGLTVNPWETTYFPSTDEFYVNHDDTMYVVADGAVREEFPDTQWHERTVSGQTYFVRNSSTGVTVYDASGETVDSYDSVTAVPSPADADEWSLSMPLPVAADRVGVDVDELDFRTLVVDDNGTLAATDEIQLKGESPEYAATSEHLLRIRPFSDTRYVVKDVEGDCVASFGEFQLRNPLQGNISTVESPKHVFAADGEFYVQTGDGDLFRVEDFESYETARERTSNQTTTANESTVPSTTTDESTPTTDDGATGSSAPGFSVGAALAAVLAAAAADRLRA